MKQISKALVILTGMTIFLAGTATKIRADWKEEDGKWWYATSTGYVTDWGYIDGSWYFFDQDGWMQTGWQQKDFNWYYFEDSGKMATGWFEIGEQGDWYYFENSGEMRTEDLLENGIIYYFDSSGRCINILPSQITSTILNNFTLGVWEGNTFTNSLLNLKFTFPENSIIASKEEMEEFVSAGIIVNDGTGVIAPEYANYSFAYDFSVTLNEANFELLWEDTTLIGIEEQEILEELYADAMIEVILEWILDLKYISKTAFSLGGQPATKVSIALEDDSIYGDIYFIQRESQMAMLLVSYTNKEKEIVKQIIDSAAPIS